jgi:LPS-assembly lipoprotein
MLAFLNKICFNVAGHLMGSLWFPSKCITYAQRLWPLWLNKGGWWLWDFKKRCTVFVVFSLAIIVAGCGFKLRGEADLPPELAKTYIKTNRPPGAPPSSLARTLEDLLVANGVEVTESPLGATAVIELVEENIRRRVVASDSIGDTREYTFTLEVAYRVARPNGHALLPMDTIRLARDIIYAETEVLGRQEGEAITLREMESSAAQTIVRRLETIHRSDEASL